MSQPAVGQFGVTLKSYDPADEQKIVIAADSFSAAVCSAEKIIQSTQWVIHQVTDLERD